MDRKFQSTLENRELLSDVANVRHTSVLTPTPCVYGKHHSPIIGSFPLGLDIASESSTEPSNQPGPIQ
jgi:hypothetical protein